MSPYLEMTHFKLRIDCRIRPLCPRVGKSRARKDDPLEISPAENSDLRAPDEKRGTFISPFLQNIAELRKHRTRGKCQLRWPTNLHSTLNTHEVNRYPVAGLDLVAGIDLDLLSWILPNLRH